jgi:hypothetical protein
MVDWSKAPEWAIAYTTDGAWLGENGYNFLERGGDIPCHPFVKEGHSLESFVIYEHRGAPGITLRDAVDPATPTLETMLTEWRDLEARAQAAQAEADALFEHAGQCHGEIVVRLAELGWGAPRGPMVQGEPVVTLDTPLDITDWRNLRPGDIIECLPNDGYWEGWIVGTEAVVLDVELRDYEGDLPIKAGIEGAEGRYSWGNEFRFISRPSTQP